MIEPKLLEDMVNIGYVLPPYSKIALISCGVALALAIPYFSRSYDKMKENEEKMKQFLPPIKEINFPRHQPFAPTLAYIAPTGNVTANRRLGGNRRVNLGTYLDRESRGEELTREVNKIKIREEENYAREIYGYRPRDKESYFNLFFNTVAPKPVAAGWS